ncbi:hypothetical protein KL946_003298 [Ogataea haglerorum]|uniref:Golgi apyrase n=1 Tax=Ogataea haglerorum TaxID=1937702 RepID=A0ABQ7RFI0_9ASCO|nr:hypothetical protein KL946_003298 [Ogataea haglerorum]
MRTLAPCEHIAHLTPKRFSLEIDRMAKGSVADENGIPYNYLIVIDAGSKGSRAYVYYWLSSQYLLANNVLRVPDDHVQLLKRVELDPSDLPQVQTGSKWYKKIHPGISEFHENSAHIGPKYLNYLLKKVYDIIPIEQHYRTPIFLHATAGMRLLKPTEQQEILDNVCSYLQQETNFYLPDCPSHVNIIDGDVEGLFGWIALNYLTGTLAANRSSVGLLEMGGASIQISFEPNEKETKEHYNQLINLKLATMGQEVANLRYNVYSDSFLGYGLSQMRLKYLRGLARKLEDGKEYVEDPCLAAKRRQTVELDGLEVEVRGTGNYGQCNENVYSLIANKCGDKQEVSSCLLSNTNPDFNLNSDNFYGVSGYWDTISKLLSYSDKEEDYGKIYAYDKMVQETEKICSLNWNELKDYKDLKKSELEELCFKSTYLMNLLHNGFGLNHTRSQFTVNDNVNGSAFTWTLGRAVLYASDESLIEVQNYVHDEVDDGKRDKVGYSRNSAPGVFVRGSEVDGVPPRPVYEVFDTYEEPGFLRDLKEGEDYENDDVVEEIDHKSIFKAHSWIVVLIVMVGLISVVSNKSRVLRLINEIVLFVVSLVRKYIQGRVGGIHWPYVTRNRYKRARSMDLGTSEVELSEMDVTEPEDPEFDLGVEDDDVLSGYEDFDLSEDSDDGIERAV